MNTLYLNRSHVIEYSSVLIDPFKRDWKYVFETNCYAYALGLDIPVNFLGKYDDSIHYDPGFFGGNIISSSFTEEELNSSILSDMDALGLCCCDAPYDVKLEEGEWKIAIYGAVTSKPGYYKDFHFIKNTGHFFWMHKQGFGEAPTNFDSDGHVILDPTKCNISEIINGSPFKYEYIKTYKIRKGFNDKFRG